MANIEVSSEEHWVEIPGDSLALYLQFLEIGGKTDWRPPTATEMWTIKRPAGLMNTNRYWIKYKILQYDVSQITDSRLLIPVRDI